MLEETTVSRLGGSLSHSTWKLTSIIGSTPLRTDNKNTKPYHVGNKVGVFVPVVKPVLKLEKPLIFDHQTRVLYKGYGEKDSTKELVFELHTLGILGAAFGVHTGTGTSLSHLAICS
eukprot:scaffold166479_cov58-Attheya_sp.AAC.1